MRRGINAPPLSEPIAPKVILNEFVMAWHILVRLLRSIATGRLGCLTEKVAISTVRSFQDGSDPVRIDIRQVGECPSDKAMSMHGQRSVQQISQAAPRDQSNVRSVQSGFARNREVCGKSPKLSRSS